MHQRFNGNLAERLTAIQIEDPVAGNGLRKKEAPLKQRCLKWLKSLPKTKAYARRGGPGRRGEPDISGCSYGIRIEIELKVPGKTPTDLQNFKIKEWQNAGAIAGWANSFEDFKNLIYDGFRDRNIKIADIYCKQFTNQS